MKAPDWYETLTPQERVVADKLLRLHRAFNEETARFHLEQRRRQSLALAARVAAACIVMMSIGATLAWGFIQMFKN